MNRIIFLLPCLDIDAVTGKSAPVGGFKVIYEYANRFAHDGYHVTLVYPHCRNGQGGLLQHARSFAGYCGRSVLSLYHTGEWFPLDPKVKKQVVYRLSKPWLKLKDNDIVFASAYETAMALSAYSEVPQENKFYFIQGHELWAASAEAVDRSYLLGMHNIVIAPWLKDIVEKAGAEATVVTNGFDPNEFKLLRPVAERSRYEVALLHHTLNHKRCCDAWAALHKVKQRHPELHVNLFGVFDPPADMPQWCTYHRNPSGPQLEKLYNESAIYLAASDFEGFGLTVGEAMMCGCAVACTNNGGFSCMAKHESTALLSDVYDVDGLAANVCRLMENDKLRNKLATAGNTFIKQFDWKLSYEKLKHMVDTLSRTACDNL